MFPLKGVRVLNYKEGESDHQKWQTQAVVNCQRTTIARFNNTKMHFAAFK